MSTSLSTEERVSGRVGTSRMERGRYWKCHNLNTCQHFLVNMQGAGCCERGMNSQERERGWGDGLPDALLSEEIKIINIFFSRGGNCLVCPFLDI